MTDPRKLHAWLLPLGWAALLFILSSLPDVPGADLFEFSDKVGHVVLYLPLGFGLLRAITLHPGPFSSWQTVWAFALGAGYAVFDELHQSFVPGRSADPADVIADSIGLILGLLLYRRIAARPQS